MLLRVGMVVFRGITTSVTPPRVSTPRDNGVTSRSSDILDLAREHARLNGGADGDHLVGVDPAVGLLAEELGDHLLHHRDAGRTADQNHLVDILGLETGILEGLTAGLQRPIDQRA